MMSYISYMISAKFVVLLFCTEGSLINETTHSQATTIAQTFLFSSVRASGNATTSSQNILINGSKPDASPTKVPLTTFDVSLYSTFSSGSIILDSLTQSLSSLSPSSSSSSSSPLSEIAEDDVTSSFLQSSSSSLLQLTSLLSSSPSSSSSLATRNGLISKQDVQSTTTDQQLQQSTTTIQQLQQSTTTIQQLQQSSTTIQQLQQSSTTIQQLQQSTATNQQLQQTTTTHFQNNSDSSPFAGSLSGWAAGPAIGGILGLTTLFASAYIVGKERRRRGSSLNGPAASCQSFNENPAFVASDAESRPKPVKVQKFASYVDDLHKDGDKKFHSQYQMLTKLTSHREKSASELPQNRNKNRYANILPYDRSRVKLSPSEVDQQATDYINASYIPGETCKREYVAAQGPLSNTLADFWRMVWEQNVSCIVMLTSLKEDGKDKCAKYWPSKSEAYQDEFLGYGEVQVCLSSESVLNHYIIRILKVQMDEVCRTVRQYHFLDWTDSRCPSEVENFLNFTRDVRAFSNRNSPVLVHCSSGSGRTGTFILVDRMLQVVDAGRELDLFGTTLQMREHRIFMVQNESQYVYAHDAVKRAVNEKSFGASHHGFDGFYEGMP